VALAVVSVKHEELHQSAVGMIVGIDHYKQDTSSRQFSATSTTSRVLAK